MLLLVVDKCSPGLTTENSFLTQRRVIEKRALLFADVTVVINNELSVLQLCPGQWLQYWWNHSLVIVKKYEKMQYNLIYKWSLT